ncbi:ketopantoate reductase family protein [Rothia kristinae]
MEILIHGAGAMGLYFAARLQQAGHRVRLVARTGWADAPRVRIATEDAEETVELAEVTDAVPEGAAPDLVVLAVKAWAVPEVLRDLSTRVPAGTPFLPLQNGVTAPEHVVEAFPQAPVLASTCVVIVQRTAPGWVSLLGREAQLTVGVFSSGDAGEPEEALGLAERVFAGTPVELVPVADVQRALWKKLALIASYGGVGAVTGLTVGQTRADGGARSLVWEGIEEVRSVARAHGVEFTGEDAAEVFAVYTDGFAAGTTSSMQRDLAAGRPSELEDQTGTVVARAGQVGVDVPVHGFIYRTQSAREAIARAEA